MPQPPTTHPDLALIRSALARDPGATRVLIRRLTPVIQARIARCLVRSSAGRSRNARQEVADLAQDTFQMLLEHDGRVLLRWDPVGGLSLENFVGLVAKRHALSVLRSRRRSPWSDDPIEDLDRLLHGGPSPEHIVATQQLMERTVADLESELSPKGQHLFQRLFVDNANVAEVCEELNMSRDAVYAWKSRLGKVVRQKVSALMSDSGSQPQTPPTKGES